VILKKIHQLKKETVVVAAAVVEQLGAFTLCSCEVKFMQEHGVARLWEVARFDFSLPRN